MLGAQVPDSGGPKMSGDALVDAELLRAEVRQKYKEVAVDPGGDFHFHTGRPLADRLG